MDFGPLIQWGLTEQHKQEAEGFPGLALGRVTSQSHDLYQVVTAKGECTAKVSGKFRYGVLDPSGFPAVGDWVMLETQSGGSIIHAVLSRKSLFARKAAGTKETTQVIAANIDTLFICMSLNSNFNINRLERYLAAAWNSGATPAVILTKSDLCDNLEQMLQQVKDAAPFVDIAVCTSEEENGYSAILPLIKPGATVAFVGSSGVGKSTVINFLMNGEILATSAVRADGKGRHTTTRRQMLLLPGGGIVIDTPGMREFGIASADTDKVFPEIEALIGRCRFSDCDHTSEPGCAVLAAIENGELPLERWQSYQKIAKEAAYNGLSARRIEEAKINRMFGSKKQMKQMMDDAKNKNRREH